MGPSDVSGVADDNTGHMCFPLPGVFERGVWLNYGMTRIDKEKRVVGLMIALYCRKKEGNGELCGSCRQLLEYAHARLDRCPFGERKGSCSRCRVHCYSPVMRERIRRVMRFSGPRMILYSPLEALRHMVK